MAYTVDAAFNQFYDAINLSGDHRGTANTRKDHLVGLLKNSFNIVDAFGSGSITRFTALKDHADLDVMVVLHYSKHVQGKQPTAVLQSVRDALGEYRSQVRKNGQAVTLPYTTWPNVDIVPVYYTHDHTGNITHYNVPDSTTETWISSRPKQHADAVEAKATECGANFRKFIKIMKWWNGRHGAYLQSYHIEVMALKALTGNQDDLPWCLYQFFDSCTKLAAAPLFHDLGFSDSYLGAGDRYEAVKRLTAATIKARDAWYETYGGRNKPAAAIEHWKQLFGDKYPAYG